MAVIGDIVTVMDSSVPGGTYKSVVVEVHSPDSFTVRRESDGKTTLIMPTVTRWGWIRHRVFGNKIIDIGCGEGLTFRDHPLASRVTGVDLDNWNPPGYAKFVQCDAENLPFDNDTFDCAVISEVLEHVADPVKILKEARRVAKFILFTTPNEHAWSKNARPMMPTDEWETQTANITTASIHCIGTIDNKEKPHLFHVRYWTMATLAEAFVQAGLTAHIETHEYDTLANTKTDERQHWSFFVGWAK